MAQRQVADSSTITFTRANRRLYICLTGSVLVFVATIIAVAVGVTVSKANTTRAEDEAVYQRWANELLDRVPLVDGHNDFPWQLRQNYGGDLNKANMSSVMVNREGWYEPFYHPSMTDIPRLRQGKVGGVFWSVFAVYVCTSQLKDAVKTALQQIDLIRRFTAKYPDDFELVTTADGILRAHKNKRIASMIGIEGGNLIENSLAVLRMFYDLGARYMTVTWSCDTLWADSVNATRFNYSDHNGLTSWGQRVVKEMNRLGMIVDLSHVGWKTMEVALNVSTAPVAFSHSSAFAICPHHRNVPDEILRKLKDNGGIIMVNMFAGFINCTEDTAYIDDNRTSSMEQVLQHLNHIKQVIGVDHIGIGADFDGNHRPTTGLEDVSTYPILFANLLKNGWSEVELEMLASGNIIRVWKAIEDVRDRLIDEPADDTPFREAQSCISERMEIQAIVGPEVLSPPPRM